MTTLVVDSGAVDQLRCAIDDASSAAEHDLDTLFLRTIVATETAMWRV
jgi:hypothetical protein